MFAWGHDFFGDLRPYNLDPGDRDAVADAWQAFGRGFLAEWPAVRDLYAPGLPDPQPWALQAFGDPR